MWYRWLFVFGLFSWHSFAAPTLSSAVSGNFPDGLHARYIQYFSEQLGAQADIVLMPYARRLIELDDGTIDLMVGVSETAPVGAQTVLLQPAYDSLEIGIFVLAGNESNFTVADDLRKRLLSLTRHANSDAIIDNIPAEHIVPARSLEQKIDMLLKGRIDGFLHVAQSTSRKLNELGLTQKIVPATYQPPQSYRQYVAINTSSWLYDSKEELERIIRLGLANGDFNRIRQRYYADQE